MEALEKNHLPKFEDITLGNAQILTDLRLRIGNDKTPEELVRKAHKFATDPNRKAIISMEGDVPTGFVEMMIESSDLHQDSPAIDLEGLAHIVRIAVVEQYRRRGIGEALMNQADEWAKTHGKKGIWLDYLAANEKAGKLYEKLGYKDAVEFVDTKKKQKIRRVTVKYFS